MSTNHRVGYRDPTQFAAVYEAQETVRHDLRDLHKGLLALDDDTVYELAVTKFKSAPLQFNSDTLKILGFVDNDNFKKVFSLLLEKGKTVQDRNNAVILFPQSFEHGSK